MGFRPDKGSLKAVETLLTYISIQFSKNNKVVSLILDIKAAYDQINAEILYEEMEALEIYINIRHLILNLLSNGKVCIKNKNKSPIDPH